MTREEAQTLIDAAMRTGYKPTVWEQKFLARFAFGAGAVSEEDRTSIIELYRRATGGGRYERRTVYGYRQGHTAAEY